MIRLPESDKAYLVQLAKQHRQSMTKVIQQLLREHREQNFFDGLKADYLALRKDTKSWNEEKNEQLLWDNTVKDGLEGE